MRKTVRIFVSACSLILFNFSASQNAFPEDNVSPKSNISSEKNAFPENNISSEKNISKNNVSSKSVKNKAEYKSLGFPGINKKQVKTLRKKYLTTHKNWLYNILDEAEPYRIYVRNKIAERKMPRILEYLPVVESNYNPDAVSKSGATGMWQFMLNSVEPFLVVNEYIDERLDPWKSTEAALSKLSDNYKMFGDWLLAITAYNCGAGALKRAIEKAGSSDFWYLCENKYLSEQASGYVPKLIAVADVAENALYYGIKMPTARDWKGETIDMRAGMFDYVSVKRSVQISDLAKELRIDEEELLSLNSSLVKKITPPDTEFKIRFPEGMKESAERALDEMQNR